MSPATQKTGRARGNKETSSGNKKSQQGTRQREALPKQVSILLGERTKVILYRPLDKFLNTRVARIFNMKIMVFYFQKSTVILEDPPESKTM